MRDGGLLSAMTSTVRTARSESTAIRVGRLRTLQHAALLDTCAKCTRYVDTTQAPSPSVDTKKTKISF